MSFVVLPYLYWFWCQEEYAFNRNFLSTHRRKKNIIVKVTEDCTSAEMSLYYLGMLLFSLIFSNGLFCPNVSPVHVSSSWVMPNEQNTPHLISNSNLVVLYFTGLKLCPTVFPLPHYPNALTCDLTRSHRIVASEYCCKQTTQKQQYLMLKCEDFVFARFEADKTWHHWMLQQALYHL